ncbi:hypothetical protein B296_00000232 [Ensete ventricosum]|uniref:Uncharacterized protein n=1 Tax=Ensete ventricosum TaxID=4639 RepID=A0A426ZPW4_ENSVE|nr:hypothetical protein B296_00000232 [Ensete ventricosum]
MILESCPSIFLYSNGTKRIRSSLLNCSHEGTPYVVGLGHNKIVDVGITSLSMIVEDTGEEMGSSGKQQ